MNVWFVWGETPLKTIFDWCWREGAVDRLLLSARLYGRGRFPVDMKPGVQSAVTSLFGNSLLETKLVSKWPGTELFEHRGVVFRIAFEPSLIVPMERTGELLGDWKHGHKPRLPEDPCLYRQGADWPLFFSVTHEDSGWIIAEKRPPFCAGKPLNLEPERLLVPSAAEGFLGD